MLPPAKHHRALLRIVTRNKEHRVEPSTLCLIWIPSFRRVSVGTWSASPSPRHPLAHVQQWEFGMLNDTHTRLCSRRPRSRNGCQPPEFRARVWTQQGAQAGKGMGTDGRVGVRHTVMRVCMLIICFMVRISEYSFPSSRLANTKRPYASQMPSAKSKWLFLPRGRDSGVKRGQVYVQTECVFLSLSPCTGIVSVSV